MENIQKDKERKCDAQQIWKGAFKISKESGQKNEATDIEGDIKGSQVSF